MKRKLSITVSDWLYEMLDLDKTDNKSDRIEEMCMKGTLAEDGQIEKKNKAIFIMKQDLKIKDDEIKKLRTHISQMETMDNKSKLLQQKLVDEQMNKKAAICSVCENVISEEGKRHQMDCGTICEDCFMTGRDSHTWIKKKGSSLNV